MKKGTLFVISGPSGCGKGTVLKEVLKNPDLYFSVSATTRDPRPGEGAMKVRAARPDAVFVFILPPSMTELENRLRGRGTEAEEVVQKRVAQAKREIGFAEKYDYVVINDDLSAAIADVNAILCAESHKTKKNLEEIKEVLGK